MKETNIYWAWQTLDRHAPLGLITTLWGKYLPFPLKRFEKLRHSVFQEFAFCHKNLGWPSFFLNNFPNQEKPLNVGNFSNVSNFTNSLIFLTYRTLVEHFKKMVKRSISCSEQTAGIQNSCLSKEHPRLLRLPNMVCIKINLLLFMGTEVKRGMSVYRVLNKFHIFY